MIVLGEAARLLRGPGIMGALTSRLSSIRRVNVRVDDDRNDDDDDDALSQHRPYVPRCTPAPSAEEARPLSEHSRCTAIFRFNHAAEKLDDVIRDL